MLVPLVKPSLAAIRARSIQEKLREAVKQHHASVRIVASGKTGSGKSTLGNRLIGIDYFLKSDGHQDCTDVVNIIQFQAGLEYLDLPGVSSSEQFENYNRAALGMPQVADWPLISELALDVYDYQRQHQERKIAVSEESAAQLQPDLVFYLVAPHQKLLREERTYIADLLRRYRNDQIVYIINLFSEKKKGVTITTPQDIEDAKTQVAAVHKRMGQGSASIVEVNCWTGQGMADLIALARASLPGEKGALFEEIMRYQQQKTPNAYVGELKNELMRFFAEVVFEKPDPTKPNPLESYMKSLIDFLGSLDDQKQIKPAKFRQLFNNLINQIVQSCTQVVTETVYVTRYVSIYESVPIYKEIEETDYSNPIKKFETEYTTESYWDDTSDPIEFIESIFDGNAGRTKRWRTVPKQREVIVGYGTKTRRVHDGYERVYTGSVPSSEPNGTRVVDTIYHPFGFRGIALLATCCNAMVVQSAGTKSQQSIEQTYEQMAGKLQAPLTDCHTLSADRVVQLLKKLTDVLFTSSFNEDVKRFSHI